MPATRITWRDAQTMPEDGKRYEAIGGELHVSPPPETRHQWTITNLVDALLRLLVHPGHGHVLVAPIGVEFPDTEEGVQPDIVFVSTSRLHIVREGGRSLSRAVSRGRPSHLWCAWRAAAA